MKHIQQFNESVENNKIISKILSDYPWYDKDMIIQDSYGVYIPSENIDGISGVHIVEVIYDEDEDDDDFINLTNDCESTFSKSLSLYDKIECRSRREKHVISALKSIGLEPKSDDEFFTMDNSDEVIYETSDHRIQFGFYSKNKIYYLKSFINQFRILDHSYAEDIEDNLVDLTDSGIIQIQSTKPFGYNGVKSYQVKIETHFNYLHISDPKSLKFHQEISKLSKRLNVDVILDKSLRRDLITLYFCPKNRDK